MAASPKRMLTTFCSSTTCATWSSVSRPAARKQAPILSAAPDAWVAVVMVMVVSADPDVADQREREAPYQIIFAAHAALTEFAQQCKTETQRQADRDAGGNVLQQQRPGVDAGRFGDVQHRQAEGIDIAGHQDFIIFRQRGGVDMFDAGELTLIRDNGVAMLLLLQQSGVLGIALLFQGLFLHGQAARIDLLGF